jgi:hypothetical protein
MWLACANRLVLAMGSALRGLTRLTREQGAHSMIGGSKPHLSSLEQVLKLFIVEFVVAM